MDELIIDKTCRRGDAGPRVRIIQEWLCLHGNHVAIDGDFGEEQITVTDPKGFEVGYGVAIWDANANGFHSLILVTSDFHMPRAMLELRAALPDAHITPYAVRTSELDAKHWWRSREGVRRMTLEYVKYLVIMTRETLAHLGGKAHHAPAPADVTP